MTRVPAPLRAAALALVTPLLEKSDVKTRHLDMPLVLSMTRVVVLAFAIADLHEIWTVGVVGWPEATLSIAVVLALPLLGALERMKPEATLELAKTLIGRFGEGGVRHLASVFDREPSKYDDHRDDSTEALAPC